MTAGAMVVGMLPMAIGGPGEEQNSVLARAVIGGLLVGTLTTLFVVPYLYTIIHQLKARFQGTGTDKQGSSSGEAKSDASQPERQHA